MKEESLDLNQALLEGDLLLPSLEELELELLLELRERAMIRSAG